MVKWKSYTVARVIAMSRDLEMMAEMMGEDLDEIKRDLAEFTSEELEKS